MDDSKHPLTSRAIWAGLVALAASLGLLGEISASDQAALVDQLLAAVAALGAIGAIVGRYIATSRLH